MAFDLPLSKKLKSQGWKIKIRERERLEPPHVTILHGAEEWRLGLRDGKLLVPPGGNVRDIDPEVIKAIEAGWARLIREWDARYPTNPVAAREDDDE